MILKKNILANYLGQGWSALMGFAFIPAYVNYVGIEGYALIGLFAAMQVWLSLLDMGMSPSLSREMARFTAGAHTAESIRDLLRSVEIVAFTSAFLISLVLYWSSDWLAGNWLRIDNLRANVVTETLILFSLIISLRLCESLYRSALIGLQQQVWCNVASALLATLRHGGALLLLAYVSPTVQAFFIWQGLISLFVLVVFIIKLYYVLPTASRSPHFSIRALKGIWRFAGGSLGVNFLGVVLTQIDKVFLAHLLTLENFGYYMLSATISGGLYMAVGPITQAIYPMVVQLYTRSNIEGLADVYHMGSQLVTVVITPVTALFIFYSEGFIFAWSGNSELALKTAPILSPLAFGTFLNCLIWMPYQCQLAHGWTSLTLKTNLIGVLVLVPAIVSIVPKYGAIGAAWIWVIFNVGYLTITVNVMYRHMLSQEKWEWYISDILVPVVGVIVVSIIFQLFKPENSSSRLEWFVFIAIYGSVSYATVTILSGQIRRRLKVFFRNI